MNSLDLPRRPGDRPATTTPSREHPPHQQTSQNAPEELQEELHRRASALDGVRVADSLVSVPGARAYHLDPSLAKGPSTAFQRGTEFAHLHPPFDGSLHLTLPRPTYDEVRAKGWGEPHPVSETMMLFGPRDREELEIVWSLVHLSYRFARGEVVE